MRPLQTLQDLLKSRSEEMVLNVKLQSGETDDAGEKEVQIIVLSIIVALNLLNR